MAHEWTSEEWDLFYTITGCIIVLVSFLVFSSLLLKGLKVPERKVDYQRKMSWVRDKRKGLNIEIIKQKE
jgi:hypothetical protein